ncbi:hypothetical protein OIU83_01425 [Flavobacterium sp. LS1R49]|uniref:Uncharacterized protein n=1 Tax=Flavobacterium shii TaxID=2987687 RepID=A0A9X2Z8V0_9FLAO|nr:hypothetical protein [Flavobacterium shii]MCV9926296.1 hypothetical protein [Flavobacterium shii]
MENYNIKNPYYELYPNLNCSGIVLVNDVPVFSFLGEDSKDGILDGSVPINHIVLESGKYKVVGKLLPRFGQKTLTQNDGMNISFNLSDIDNWKETKHSFFPELSSPKAFFGKDNKITSPIKGLPFFEIATEIEIKLPFVLDGWQNSVDLSKQEKSKIKQKVLEYYIQIHAILREHNASKFLELSKEKEDLQTKAFYFNSNRKQEIRDSIINLFNKNLEVLPLNEEELKLEFFGYGKLVSLVRLDGSSALQFKRSNAEGERNIELEIKLHARTLEKGLSII